MPAVLRPILLLVAGVLALAAAGCASRAPLVPPDGGEIGIASWYGPGFHGRRTANGERFDANGLSAAHRELALGTRVRVTNLANGRSVILRINDRGPHVRGRIIDVSYGAARALGMVRSGLARVRVEPLDPPFGPARRTVARSRRRSRSRAAARTADRAARRKAARPARRAPVGSATASAD